MVSKNEKQIKYMKLLLVLSAGMSLKNWEELGQLSRELNIYQKLGEKIGHIFILSSGKNEDKYVINYPNISVISKYKFIPDNKVIPLKLKLLINYIYYSIVIIHKHKLFKSIDIIKTNQFSNLLIGSLLKFFFNKKLIIRMGFYHSHFLKPKLIRKVNEFLYFNFCDKIILTQKDAQNYINEKYKVENKTYYIPNYIDTQIFDNFNKKEKKYDVLFVGRFHPEKNINNLLLSIKDLNLNSCFIGNGELYNYINDFASNSNIKVEIKSKVKNNLLPEYYNKTRLFVLPSLYEGNPKTLLEAMSCGCICIGTDVNGINNIISNNINGFLCNTNNESIQKAIEYCIINYDKLDNVAFKARNYIIENCDLNKVIEKEICIYNKL